MNCPQCGTRNPDEARFCSNCGAKLEPKPADGERRFVTILFADVVGSTGLGERLDPEELTELMNGAIAFMNAAVKRHGGTVARLMGDAILAFFGAPRADEDDPLRAVRAGLEIRDNARVYAGEVSRRYGLDFSVRVGINSGLVVLSVVGDEVKTEYTAMGDTANVAARLQSVADPGSVFVSGTTWRLARESFDFNPRGALEVKGRAEPVDVYEVIAAKERPGSRRGLAGIASPLVGRDPELGQLREALEAVRAGQGRLILVSGEAGIGKSRLIAEARQLATTDLGIRWFEGRASSFGQAPYMMWAGLLRGIAGIGEQLGAEATRSRLTEHLDEIGLERRWLPFLEALMAVETEDSAAALRALDPTTLVDASTEAVRTYLLQLAAVNGPVVIAFDDLHWADTPSLNLLVAIIDRLIQAPIGVVAVFRPDKRAASYGATQQAFGKVGRSAVLIELEPLSAAASSELLGNLLHIQDLPASLRDLILKKSEGNPFFVEEVIRSLIDGGYVVQEGDHWRATRSIVEVAIPDTLTGVLTARIDRLPDTTKRVMEIAAVIGRIFAEPVLEAVCTRGEPEDRVDPLPHLITLTYEELVRERARHPDLEYIFKHALTQEAAYSLLLLRRRKELHQRVGQVLEELYGDRLDELAAVLAHHYWLAEDWPRAGRFAFRAGERASRLIAVTEAAHQFERAIQAMERAGRDIEALERSRALLAWVQTAYKSAPHDELVARAELAASLAREAGDKRQLGYSLSWVGNLHILGGNPSRGYSALAETSQLATELGDDQMMLLPLFAMTWSLVNRNPQRALADLDRLVDLARQERNEETEAHALAIKGLVLGRLGRFTDAKPILDRALELAERTGSKVKLGDVAALVGLVAFEMGDAASTVQRGRVAAELSMSVGGIECACGGYLVEALGALALPDTADALAAMERAAAVATLTVDPETRNQVRGAHALARFASGDHDALRDLEEAVNRANELDDVWIAAIFSHGLAESYLSLGQLEQAAAALTPAMDYFRAGGMKPALARALRTHVAILRAQDRTTDAAAAQAELDSVLTEIETARQAALAVGAADRQQ